jgi:hypothetical protein
MSSEKTEELHEFRKYLITVDCSSTKFRNQLGFPKDDEIMSVHFQGEEYVETPC